MKDINSKLNHIKSVISDPDGYNTNLASKDRVENLEQKLTLLHNKIDSIYTLLETLSNRLNTLEYHGTVQFGDKYHTGRTEKQINVKLHREKDKIKTPNPYGDDDFATPT